jgi:hypothetical protein
MPGGTAVMAPIVGGHMKGTTETKLDILKALMAEDRQEIRGIRQAVYSAVVWLSTASFAITAFLLGKGRDLPNGPAMCVLTDALIIVLLWALFLGLRQDLYHCRQALGARQRLVGLLGTAEEPEDIDLFPDATAEMPDIADRDIWRLPLLASAAIAIKSLVLSAWLGLV